MSTTDPTHAVPRWKVTGQTMAQVQNAQGVFVPGWIVTYQLSSGTSGSVRIPEDRYNPAAVRAAIDMASEHVAAIDGLSSD